ncbi:hypothetical protein D3C76_1143910 [compost metagenome]
MRKEGIGADALVGVGDDHAALDQVLQFADIAWPVIPHAGFQGLVGEAQGGLAIGRVQAREEVLRQQRDVFLALAQRGDEHRVDIQPVVEVGAEAAFLHGLGEVLMGGGNHPHVHLACL